MDTEAVLRITVVVGDVGAWLTGGSLLHVRYACSAPIRTGMLHGLRIEHSGDASVPTPLSPFNFRTTLSFSVDFSHEVGGDILSHTPLP